MGRWEEGEGGTNQRKLKGERRGDGDEERNNQRFTRVWRKREGRRPVKVTKSHLTAERASLNKENDREEEREAEAVSHPGMSPNRECPASPRKPARLNEAPPERWTPPFPPR